jgi:hypothetical protein
MDLATFLRDLVTEELQALVNRSSDSVVQGSPLRGADIYLKLTLQGADELTLRLQRTTD